MSTVPVRARAVDLLSLHLMTPEGTAHIAGTPRSLKSGIAESTHAVLGSKADGWDDAIHFIESQDETKIPQLRAQAAMQLKRQPERMAALAAEHPFSPASASAAMPYASSVSYDAAEVKVAGEASVNAQLQLAAAQRIQLDTTSGTEIHSSTTQVGEPVVSMIPTGVRQTADGSFEQTFGVLVETPVTATVQLTMRSMVEGLQRVVAEAALQQARVNPQLISGVTP